MKIVVIGAKGHIGTYLVPRLVREGHAVVAVTRGHAQPYRPDWTWAHVENLTLDRRADPDFAAKIAALAADVVVDLINFPLEDTHQMVAALAAAPRRCSHYLFCSSIWAHGRAQHLPADPNDLAKEPLDDYGRNKFASELFLKDQYRQSGFPATVVMPGQISGPGWTIINPLAGTSVAPFQAIAKGEEIKLPGFGMETLHHVHAEDVAQVFDRAIAHREAALGQSFHAVGPDSITLYGYARAMYRYFGREPKIEFLPWEDWKAWLGDQAEADCAYYHMARSGQYGLENGRQLIDYQPRYTDLETIEQAVGSYVERGLVKVE